MYQISCSVHDLLEIFPFQISCKKLITEKELQELADNLGDINIDGIDNDERYT